MAKQRAVPAGVSARPDVALLARDLNHLWPVDEAHSFSQLLQAIDEADQELSRQLHHCTTGFCACSPDSQG